MTRIVVTGATGMIGRALLQRLPDALVLSRDPNRAAASLGGAQVVPWSPLTEPAPARALRGAEVVFHLAGEPISDARWTAAKKRRILDSRVTGTRQLVAGLAELERPPRVLVSASAVGYYGDRGDELLDESSRGGTGFLAEVCEAWEHAADSARALGIRVVKARFGVVLGSRGGALDRLLPLFKRGLGGRLGSGRQWISWIHADDAAGILVHAAGEPEVEGPINVVAPMPVTNAEFTRTLARELGRPANFAVPEIALRAALGELSQVLLSSQRVMPWAARVTGYQFQHGELAGALATLLAPSSAHAVA